MTTVHTLASGSSGNAALLSCDGASFLIDAGISCRRITAALKALSLIPGRAGRYFYNPHPFRPYLRSADAFEENGLPHFRHGPRLPGASLPADGQTPVLWPSTAPRAFWAYAVTAVPTSHDAPGSCGCRFDTEDGSVGFLTDTGYVTDEALDLLPGWTLRCWRPTTMWRRCAPGRIPTPSSSAFWDRRAT